MAPINLPMRFRRACAVGYLYFAPEALCAASYLKEKNALSSAARLKKPATVYLFSLTVRAWQHAYNKICTLSCTFHSRCWTDKGGGQRGEIKCHNESKGHNSFWSNALRDESCSGEPFWPLMGLQPRERMRRDWRAHINSNYSQCMRSCKWRPHSGGRRRFPLTNPHHPTRLPPFWKCPLRLFLFFSFFFFFFYEELWL